MSPSQKQTTRRYPIGLFLLVAFVAVPLAEIAVFIEVGSIIGLGWTLLLIVLTAVAGTSMLRWQGFAVLRRAQDELRQDRVPVREVFEGVCLLVAGLLLLTPGFITDALGGLLLLPPVRAYLYRLVSARIEAHVVGGPGRPYGEPRAGDQEPPVIDVEFEEVEPDHKDSRSMPPPRGDWGPRE